ncbi:MAG: putative manganese transporter, partial [Gemmatimonadales bacterium]
AYTVWIGLGGSGVPDAWNWVRLTLLLVGVFGTFVVVTVPDHFLQEHLWRHVAVGHVPRIFAWTAGVLIGVAVLQHVTDLEALVRENLWTMLAAAALLGVIPESGPHLVFVTMYAAGGIPISILVASSIVQDGHGMLPLLAHSRKDFLRVKTVNLVLGLVVGAALLALGA